MKAKEIAGMIMLIIGTLLIVWGVYLLVELGIPSGSWFGLFVMNMLFFLGIGGSLFIIGLILLLASRSTRKKPNKTFLKTFPYICAKCGAFSNMEREYCEECGEKDNLRKTILQYYEQYLERVK